MDLCVNIFSLARVWSVAMIQRLANDFHLNKHDNLFSATP